MDTKKIYLRFLIIWAITLFALFAIYINISGQIMEKDHSYTYKKYSYAVAGTGVTSFYNNREKINKPDAHDVFFAQDAAYQYNQPRYRDNGDGTISDLVTGLMWQQNLLTNKLTYHEALEKAKTFDLAGYDDWRLPSIKELYSLIMFYGEDPSGVRGNNTSHLQPFINTTYFDFRYGDPAKHERIIDAQYVTATKYVSTTMHGNPTVFGINLADGRIKGYPISSPRGEKQFEVIYVRNNNKYGINNFKDNGDLTVTDNATGLMWGKKDSKQAMNWEEALAWVQQKNKENYLGYNDWRLPDAKELQSLVDYSRSPETTNSPAIDPVFVCSEIKDAAGNKGYPYYWSSTTHVNSRGFCTNAVYVSFGKALGWLKQRYNKKAQLTDVHGAGAQRSDPKVGDPKRYPYGHGPQGDVIRIYNYVRCVRSVK